MSYEYSYEVDTTTLASAYHYDDKASASVRGKASVGVIAPCEFVLSVSARRQGNLLGTRAHA